MLADVGCRYVIAGHSERRALYGESDALVVAKVKRALDVGLTPVLCVGESESEREAGQTLEVVARQLNALWDQLSVADLGSLTVAYEPVWAIGTGKTATPEQAQEMHAYSRQMVAEILEYGVAGNIRILYGGSCKPGNAREIIGQQDVDGGLIGGAALTAADFVGIIDGAEAAAGA